MKVQNDVAADVKIKGLHKALLETSEPHFNNASWFLEEKWCLNKSLFVSLHVYSLSAISLNDREKQAEAFSEATQVSTMKIWCEDEAQNNLLKHILVQFS